MMADHGNVAEVIQLALAPVFLLVAIASFLNVVTSRLGRVVDRARDLEKSYDAVDDLGQKSVYRSELRALDKRMTFNHWSINFCSASALTTALLVAFLFLSDFAEIDASGIVAVLFFVAMAGMIAGIFFFLAEIWVATRTVHVSAHLLREMREEK